MNKTRLNTMEDGMMKNKKDVGPIILTTTTIGRH